MGKLQNKSEYERCKEKGLLGRLDIKLLKEFGTAEEVKARCPDEVPKEAAKKDKPKGKK